MEVKTIDSEDETYIKGHTLRYDDKSNLEANTYWVIWKGPIISEILPYSSEELTYICNIIEEVMKENVNWLDSEYYLLAPKYSYIKEMVYKKLISIDFKLITSKINELVKSRLDEFDKEL